MDPLSTAITAVNTGIKIAGAIKEAGGLKGIFGKAPADRPKPVGGTKTPVATAFNAAKAVQTSPSAGKAAIKTAQVKAAAAGVGLTQQDLVQIVAADAAGSGTETTAAIIANNKAKDISKDDLKNPKGTLGGGANEIIGGGKDELKDPKTESTMDKIKNFFWGNQFWYWKAGKIVGLIVLPVAGIGYFLYKKFAKGGRGRRR